MLMFSIADQGPIEGWALTHAMHHVASDAGL
jgi:fatty-acid desaturase